MKVGVPTEIKADEYRVALTPTGGRELVDFGPEVVVLHGAGEGRRSIPGWRRPPAPSGRRPGGPAVR